MLIYNSHSCPKNVTAAPADLPEGCYPSQRCSQRDLHCASPSPRSLAFAPFQLALEAEALWRFWFLFLYFFPVKAKRTSGRPLRQRFKNDATEFSRLMSPLLSTATRRALCFALVIFFFFSYPRWNRGIKMQSGLFFNSTGGCDSKQCMNAGKQRKKRSLAASPLKINK